MPWERQACSPRFARLPPPVPTVLQKHISRNRATPGLNPSFSPSRRQPVHSRSVGRWQNYSDSLAALFAQIKEQPGSRSGNR